MPPVRVPVGLPIQIGMAYGNTLIEMSDRSLASTLDDAVRIGVGTLRTDLDWASIQPTSADTYEWERFDRIVNGARERGLTLLLVLAYTPAWARADGCDSHMCPPADPGRFAEFATAAATRYAGRDVLAWEIWNEPNDSGFWSPAADPEEYAELLERTSSAIRRVDPSALIVLGGLASIDTKGTSLSPSDFLSRVCQQGGNTSMSAVGYHPYTYPYLASVSRDSADVSPWNLIDRGPEGLRSTLERCGTPDVPIWLTEYGAPTGGPGAASDGTPEDTSEDTTHVTEEQQANIARDVLQTVTQDRTVQVLIWYAWRDLDDEDSTNLNFYGLRRSDGSAKPALQVFRDTLGELGLPER
jgi:polysaccharide biosynthesis protein PslG